MRRGFKIYPMFYLLLIATPLLSLHGTTGNQYSLRNVLGEIFFLQNYLDAIWNHTWSLAVEEHFYIALPLMLWSGLHLCGRTTTPLRLWPFFTAFLLLTVLLLRIAVADSMDYGWAFRIHDKTHFRADSLLYGTLLSYGYHFHLEWLRGLVRRYWRTIIVTAAIAILPEIVNPLENNSFVCTYGYTLLYLGFGNILCLVLFFDLKWKYSKSKMVQILSNIGRDSYGIYLWHMPVYIITWRLIDPSTSLPHFLLQTITYLAGSVVVGMTLSKQLERRMLRLRDRLIPVA